MACTLHRHHDPYQQGHCWAAQEEGGGGEDGGYEGEGEVGVEDAEGGG